MMTTPLGLDSLVELTADQSAIKTSTRMRYTGQSNGYKLSMNTIGEQTVNAKAQEILDLIQSNHHLGGKLTGQYYLSIDWGNPLEARLTILHSGKADEVITVDLSEKAFRKSTDSKDLAAAKAAAETVAKAIAAGRDAIQNHAEPVKSGRVKIQEVNRRGAIHGAEFSRTADVLGVRKGSNLSLSVLSPVIRAEVEKLPEDQRRKFMVELETLMLVQGCKKKHLQARIKALEAEGIKAAEEAFDSAKREHDAAKAKKIEADQKVGKLRQKLQLMKTNLTRLLAELRNGIVYRDQLVADYIRDHGSENLPGLGHAAYGNRDVTRRHKEMTAAKDKCTQLKAEITRLSATIAQLEGEIDSKDQAAVDQVVAAQLKMGKAESALNALKDIVENFTTAQSQYQANEDKKKAAEAELANLDKELELRGEEITRLQARLTAEQANLDKGTGDKGTVTKLEGQLGALTADFEARRLVIEGNQGDPIKSGTVATILGEKREIEARLFTIEGELTKRKAALDAARKELDKIEKPVGELRLALDKLDKVDEFGLAWGLLYRDRPEQSFEALKAHKNSIIDSQRKWYNRVPLFGITEVDDKKLKAYNADCLALWSKDTWDRSDLYFTVETTMSRGAENEVPLVDVMQGLLELLNSDSYPTDAQLKKIAESAGIEAQVEIEELFKEVKKIFEEADKFKQNIERLDNRCFQDQSFWDAFKAGTLGTYVATRAAPQQAQSP
jgi:predicted  nucleic acid-binding Zn-ribbon protein